MTFTTRAIFTEMVGAGGVKAEPARVRIAVDLAAILIAATRAGANKVHGVTFDVAAKPELRARARQEAVAAAWRKAELYAAASRIRLGQVIHVEDVDLETLERQAFRGHGGGSGAASAADLAPGHVTVSAAVVLGFAILPG